VTPTVADVAPAAGPKAVANCDKKIDLKAQTLMFAFDKADLTDEHKAKIKAVAENMVACKDDKVVLAGYTDVTGSKLYNKWLSQQRAEAAVRGMIRDGVEKSRLKAVGYGEQYPLAANTTKAGRAQNRRVEFVAGDVLPHADGAVVKVAPVKAAVVKAKKTSKKVSSTQVSNTTVKQTVIEVVSDTKAMVNKTTAVVVSATDVAVSKTQAIAKPWWARKTVSDTSVEVK
jgi:hypothetical protein